MWAPVRTQARSPKNRAKISAPETPHGFHRGPSGPQLPSLSAPPLGQRDGATAVEASAPQAVVRLHVRNCEID